MLSYFLAAETKLFVDPPHAKVLAAIGMGLLNGLPPRLTTMLYESWPLEQAISRLASSQEALQRLQDDFLQFSVDFVVAHCREDLTWLQTALAHWALPGRSRLFIYEKCGRHGVLDVNIPVEHTLVDDGPSTLTRKDECSAYLTHLARFAERGDPAMYTMFLQADALHHSRPKLLDLVVASLRHGTLNVPFLHLGRSQMVSSTSRCKRALFQQAIGRPPNDVPRGYCCAQFLVRHDVIKARGAEHWRRLLRMMDAPLPAGCEDLKIAAGMHCLLYESIWHVLFGMPERLRPRAEDVGLPIFLRFPEIDSSNLPEGADSAMYLRLATSDDPDTVAWLEDLEVVGVDLSGAKSIGYAKF